MTVTADGQIAARGTYDKVVRHTTDAERITPQPPGESGRKNVFRVRGKAVLVTYMFNDNDVGPHHEEVRLKMQSFGAKCTIAQERAPTTGRLHFHVYVQRPKPFNTRDAKCFDIGTFHPNIKVISARHQATWDYVVKGGNVLVSEVDRPEKPPKKRNPLDEVFRTGLEQPNCESMLRVIRDGAPTRFATSYLNIRACARDRFPTGPSVDYYHPRDATFDTTPWPELSDWVSEHFPNDGRGRTNPESVISDTPPLTEGPSSDSGSLATGIDDWVESENSSDIESMSGLARYAEHDREQSQPLNPLQPRPKSLILWGPSRTGKTCWARSLGRHAHHAITVNMELHEHNVEYAVFDDISVGLRGFDYKSWLGGQHHFNFTDKYMKKKTINWGRPSIWIQNEDPYETERGVDFGWLAANTVIVHIDKPMY